MFRTLALTLGLALGASAHAMDANLTATMVNVGHQIVMQGGVAPMGMNFVKGDNAAYSLQIASFIKGTMTMAVTDVGADGVWIDQAMDLGGAGKQDIKELIDPNTGAVKKMIVNGQEQAPPAAGDVQIIDSKQDTVTVPAGTFTCLYVKVQMKQNGQDTTAEQWVNPKLVPVVGMVKMIAQSQLGPVTAELTSFKRN